MQFLLETIHYQLNKCLRIVRSKALVPTVPHVDRRPQPAPRALPHWASAGSKTIRVSILPIPVLSRRPVHSTRFWTLDLNLQRQRQVCMSKRQRERHGGEELQSFQSLLQRPVLSMQLLRGPCECRGLCELPGMDGREFTFLLGSIGAWSQVKFRLSPAR